MAKKTGTTTGTTEKLEETGARMGMETLMATNGEMLRAVMKANEAALEGAVAVGREIMEFGTARVQRDLETQGSLMRCKDAEEAYRVQFDYAREATQQYFEEASKLMNLTAQITRDCWAPIEDRTRAALEGTGKR